MRHILHTARTVTFALLCHSLFPGSARAAAASSPLPSDRGLRLNVNFNREWKFQLGDQSGAAVGTFNDATWQSVGLPHSFSIPYFLGPRFYVGYGWYRKHFAVPSTWRGKRLFLEFDGSFQDTEVFVNGTRVARHLGGYTGFSMDVTGAAKMGDNVVAVRVNNVWNPRIAPRAGEHVFSGGIYRDVRLVVTAPLHISWQGTFVSTPQVSQAAATVNVKTEVVNSDSRAKICTVRQSIFDPGGKMVAQWDARQSIAVGQTATFDQTSPAISSPKLWHPDHPFLYRVRTTLLDGNAAVDRTDSPLGFRWFKWTADQGFFLNGEHFTIIGANVHQDHAGWGDAVTQAGAYRDVKMIKDAGFNFIRGSHYPHSPAFVRACDELGILFWSENDFWGTGGTRREGGWSSSAYPINAEDDAPFEASVKEQMTEMIRIHRNHPSIIAWSTGNEVFFSDGNVMPKVQAFLPQLVALGHQLDPTRPVAVGGVQRGDLDKLGDIAGYNGDGARLFINPGIPNLVTEYGSTIANRPGKYEPGWGDLPNGAGQDKTQKYPWRYVWRSGEVIWCGFDHGSIASIPFGSMGMVDYFRLPKRQWYWYRNEYRGIAPPEWPQAGTPAKLRLEADKTTIQGTDATDDAQLIVTVLDAAGQPISNNVPVTLSIESGPGEFPTGPSITFAPDSDIAIRDGKAAIEFRSYYGGPTVIRAASPGLEDARLTITTQGEPRFVAGKTPPTPPRPYRRFEDDLATVNDLAGINLAEDRPTRASSEAAGHTARFGNDKDGATFWTAGATTAAATTAAATAPGAWWQVDLENIYLVTETSIRFPTAGNYRYKIEISSDGTSWKTISDQSATTSTEPVRKDAPIQNAVGRFVRVTLTGWPADSSASLSEVQVFGRRQIATW